MSSHTTDGSAVEEENNNFTPIPLIEQDDSSSLEYLDEVYHSQEENILPSSLSMSKWDVLQVKPRDQTDYILPQLSASSSSSSSSSSSVSLYFDTVSRVLY